jgi:DNA-directed RNA polymerase specialized sigma subunit
VNQVLPLAAKIAREFSNIPGLPHAEIEVAEGIRDGKSYSEIGATLGISKQAAHKLAGAAITTLRENLESMGYYHDSHQPNRPLK